MYKCEKFTVTQNLSNEIVLCLYRVLALMLGLFFLRIALQFINIVYNMENIELEITKWTYTLL